MPRFASLCLPLTLVLGACAGTSSDYPSLAIRDVERVEGSFAAPTRETIDVPPVDIDMTAPLGETLDRLVGEARSGNEVFLEVAPRAQRFVGAAVNSDTESRAWASAQVALSELESARSVSAVPLADIDILYTAARAAAQDASQIETAREEIVSIIAAQDETLAQLRGRIR